MTVRSLLPGILAFFVAMAVLGAGCTGPQIPSPDRVTPAGTAVQDIPTGEAGPFSEETFAGEDRVVVRYVPESEEPTEYRVSYEIIKNGTTDRRVEERIYENVSRINPIAVVVVRDPGETVAIDATIRYGNGTVVWESSAAYGPVVIREL
jgi:hypothetical protein